MTELRALVMALVAAVLIPSVASADFRYLAVGDVRQSFNSHAFDLELADATVGANRGMVTEVEPGIRLYLGRPRSLFTMRYAFLGQLLFIMRTPVQDVVGYGNRLRLGFSHLLSQRTEFSISNLFEQGTENITAPTATNQTGQTTPARMVTGTRYVSEGLRFGLYHLLAKQWSVRPMIEATVYYPYGDPPDESIPPANPIYSVSASTRLTWAWFRRSALILSFGSTALFDQPDKTQFIPDELDQNGNLINNQSLRNGLPEYWRTTMIGGTLAWRWQFSDFLDAQIGGGVQYHDSQRYAGARSPTLMENDRAPAPLVDAFIRYRRARQLAIILGYHHGWSRQTELAVASSSEIDSVGLNAYYSMRDWWFELLSSFIYVRTVSRGVDADVDAAAIVFPDANKMVSGQFSVSYLWRPGFSIGASYRVDGLFDRSPTLVAMSQDSAGNALAPFPHCGQIGTTLNCVYSPNDLVRHIITVGISVAWPPPPPQEVRLTRRESEYEPMFFLGATMAGAGGNRRQQRTLPNRTIRRAPPPWQRGLAVPPQPGPASLIPEREEPPLPNRSEEEEDSGYYSWPR